METDPLNMRVTEAIWRAEELEATNVTDCTAGLG